MGDRLEEIKAHGANESDVDWLTNEVERLRQAAHADQVVIQRLRRECAEWLTTTENTLSKLWDTQAKLALAQQRAASRGGRVPR